jgi:hypothetical protein
MLLIYDCQKVRSLPRLRKSLTVRSAAHSAMIRPSLTVREGSQVDLKTPPNKLGQLPANTGLFGNFRFRMTR